MPNQNDTIVAEAIRCEIDENNNKFYIVFEVIDPYYKLKLKKEWANDLEFRICGKALTLGES